MILGLPAPAAALPPPHPTQQQQQQQQLQQQQQQQHPAAVEAAPPETNRYVLSAFRVGMLALETLARRVHDDRPQTKYAKNPPYGEDVKWLMNIAFKLGVSYLHQVWTEGICINTSLMFGE